MGLHWLCVKPQIQVARSHERLLLHRTWTAFSRCATTCCARCACSYPSGLRACWPAQPCEEQDTARVACLWGLGVDYAMNNGFQGNATPGARVTASLRIHPISQTDITDQHRTKPAWHCSCALLFLPTSYSHTYNSDSWRWDMSRPSTMNEHRWHASG